MLQLRYCTNTGGADKSQVSSAREEHCVGSMSARRSEGPLRHGELVNRGMGNLGKCCESAVNVVRKERGKHAE